MASLGIEEHRVLGIEGDQTVAMLHRAELPPRGGVVIVVGGPQYRVGSHRQFVRLAREIARAGFDVLRFDVRGMGDSAGHARSFDNLDSDIRHAVDDLCRASPTLKQVALLGLCDGATAALMYAPADARVARLVLLNPWARNESGAAKVRLRSYYLRRLLSRGFWRKLVSGKVALGGSVKEVSGATRAAIAGSGTSEFLARMERAAIAFSGDLLLFLSGADYTADEFLEWIAGTAARNARFERRGVTAVTVADANHTFSTESWHSRASREIIGFLEKGES